MIINALFIGGPIDGRRMQVGHGMKIVTVPSMPDFEAMRAMNVPPDVIPTTVDTTYTRHDFLGLPGIAVFTVGDVGTLDILERLIDGYRDEVFKNAEQ